jgi:hypothetical protein
MEGLGATLNARRLPDVPLSIRPVEQTDPHLAELHRFEVSSVDAHSQATLGNRRLPVSDTAARIAPHEVESLWTPRVRGRGTRFGSDLDLCLLVVGPQSAVSAADGAVAVRETARAPRYLDLDGAAMTGCAEHDWSVFVGPNV